MTYKDSGGTMTKHVHFTYDPLNRRTGQSIDSTGSGRVTVYRGVANFSARGGAP